MMARERIRVVVADDDARLLEMLSGLLDDLGYEVTAAVPDGQAAVDSCLQDRPDLALLDQRMPVMSGIEAAKQLHRLVPTLPVVILSAYDDAGLQQAARDAGAVTYLVKGCTASEIADVIDRAAGTDPSV